jgi:hypothetical protein
VTPTSVPLPVPVLAPRTSSPAAFLAALVVLTLIGVVAIRRR